MAERNRHLAGIPGRPRNIDCPQGQRPESGTRSGRGPTATRADAEHDREATPHVDRLASYLGLDVDVVFEGLMLAAERDLALFGAASAAARRLRSTPPEPAVQRYSAAG